MLVLLYQVSWWGGAVRRLADITCGPQWLLFNDHLPTAATPNLSLPGYGQRSLRSATVQSDS